MSVRISGCNNRKGFTLAEAMLAALILGVAAAGVLLPFTSGAVVRAEGMRRTLAAKLAGDLTEQIVNTPFEDVVAGFDGYTEPQGQVTDFAGVVFTYPAYANFSRDVSCEYVVVPQESGTMEPMFIRVTVRVYYSGKQIAVINRLITK
ncbi:MAG: type IV pilus modification PilV family protein [Planctomycetota bacterium]|jgi:prepilin-type N-terminal cleavage/methylation domain-containing protein